MTGKQRKILFGPALLLSAALGAGALVAVGVGACDPGEGGSVYARRVGHHTDLIGGPGALGTIGDWVIGNSKIRVIIQDQGWSRGFGVFGGGIIDADIVRANMTGDTGFGNGHDNYGEFFPALFLEAWDVSDLPLLDENGVPVKNETTGFLERQPGTAIEVMCDGSEPICAPLQEPAAMIRTRAEGGDFLTMISMLLELGVPRSALRYETDYILRPGAFHLEIIGRLINDDANQTIEVPMDTLLGTLESFGIEDFQVPLGDVALFGDGNHVFAPGAVFRPSTPDDPHHVGFDLRFAVEASYETVRDLPALPGLAVEFLATEGPGVSYGYAVADSERNFVWMNRDQYHKDPYTEVTKHSMVVPFLISSFTGAFYEVPPTTLEPKQMYEYTKYFIVGDGDVAAIRDELYEIRGTAYGELFGEILTQQSGDPAAHASVMIYDDLKRPYSQVTPDADGRIRCRLEAGTYYWEVTSEGIFPFSGGEQRFSSANRFEIADNGDGFEDVFIKVYIPRPSQLIVNVRDASGNPLPAKVTAVLPYQVSDLCAACTENCDLVCAPRNYLFDFSVGEHRRQTDIHWREPRGERNGRFVEKVLFGHAGEVRGLVRPSPCGKDQFDRDYCTPYDIYVSRGMEYDLEIIEGVILKAGEVRRFDVNLERVVDTEHFVSADLHLHAQPSADSFLSLEDRVIAGVAEGLEIMVATDHNYITDYGPTIASLGVQDWVKSVVGVEMTTLEMGHYNAFPLKYDITVPNHLPFVSPCQAEYSIDKLRLGGKANQTSLDWFICPPDQLFAQMRALGAHGPEATIIQANHPRDTIQGYFNQYFVNPYTLEAEEPTADNYGAMVDLIGLRPHPFDREGRQFHPSAFSLDFDAIEVFNGKRLDMNHAFVTPDDAPQEWIDEIGDFQCGTGHSQNGRGRILLENGGFPSYPGTMDDWLRLLNLGHNMTAVANSDTHHLSSEVGIPRTYLYLPPDPVTGERRDEIPALIPELDFVEALKDQRALGTNGPMLTMAVRTERATESPEEEAATVMWRIGSLVSFGGSNVGKKVTVLVSVRSAPWIDVDRVVVYANGRIAATADGDEAVFQIPDIYKNDGRAADDDWVHVFEIVTQEDTVLVAEAYGNQSLFPVVPGKEKPPANVDAALSSLLAAFGSGGGFGTFDGVHGPSYIQNVTPYAFTNPIWLDVTQPFDPCFGACMADGGISTTCTEECERPNKAFDPPGLSSMVAWGPDEKVDAADMEQCGDDGECPYNQFCDNNQTPARCRCIVIDEVRAAGAPDTPMPLPERTMGHHYRVGDIRAVFYHHMFE